MIVLKAEPAPTDYYHSVTPSMNASCSWVHLDSSCESTGTRPGLSPKHYGRRGHPDLNRGPLGYELISLTERSGLLTPVSVL